MIDVILLLLARTLYRGLLLLPHRIRIAIFTGIFQSVFCVLPRVRRSILRNLEIAFPDQSSEWRRAMLKRNAVEIGRLAADAVRLSQIDAKWVRDHVTCPVIPEYFREVKERSGKGVLVATGHLGSFEMFGYSMGLLGYPIAAVARSFRSERFNDWWTGLRKASGNSIIGRKGAFKEIISTIESGITVAVLFDQNVTRNHAVFVDWFGCPAATSKSIALAALRCEVPIVVASIRYDGNDKYVVDAVPCEFDDLYCDPTLSADEKVTAITQKISSVYVDMIKRFPEGWFWMHRRWKTRPEGEPETMYR